MVAAAFPLVKLATLAFRQLAKPIANSLKNRAKNSPFFRKYVCMPPAQAYHWMEVNVKMKLLGQNQSTLKSIASLININLFDRRSGKAVICPEAQRTDGHRFGGRNVGRDNHFYVGCHRIDRRIHATVA